MACDFTGALGAWLFVAVPRGKEQWERATKLSSMLTGAVSSSSSLSTDKHSRLAEPVRTRISASTMPRASLRTKGDMLSCSSMPSVAASCVCHLVCNLDARASAQNRGGSAPGDFEGEAPRLAWKG